jgi:hypothetical protein
MENGTISVLHSARRAKSLTFVGGLLEGLSLGLGNPGAFPGAFYVTGGDGASLNPID